MKTVKQALIFVLLLCAAGVGRMRSQDEPASSSVTGYVYGADGRPLADAIVVPFPLEAAVSGGMPFARTDANGKYNLISPAYGKTRICASKPGFGYPNTVSAIFASGAEKEPEINLTPGSRHHDIDIHLPPPDGSMEGTLTDEQTGMPIVGRARITLRRADNMAIMYATDIPKTGSFVYDLPERPIRIFITAAGYQPWKYRDPITGDEFVKIRPHEHKRIVIKLKPAS
jgi:hypothetical protein